MLICQINELEQSELRKLHNYIGKLLYPAVTYQKKPAKCKCKKCLQGGPGHGSYWYAYFTYKNKTHCIYLGKQKRTINPLDELKRKEKKNNAPSIF